MHPTAAQVPRMTQAAIQHANHRKGVTVIGFPGNVAAMEAADCASSTVNYFPKAVITPVMDELQQLATLINYFPKICIFCGIGAVEAHDEVVQLATLLKAPVGYSFRGKMGIQYDNPNEVGMTGLLGLPSAFHSMHEADLLVLLGTDFPYTQFMPVDCKIVQIDIKPERIGRLAKIEFGLHGSVK